MIRVDEATNLRDALQQAADAFGDNVLLAVPERADRNYYPQGYQITYGEALNEVRRISGSYRSAGIGHGHRIATLLDNRPENFLHKLALNAIGASFVPINPEYRSAEIAYLAAHSKIDGVVCIGSRRGLIEEGLHAAGHRANIIAIEDFDSLGAPSPHRSAPLTGPIGAATEASIQYTSGTTGRPKGCVMSHNYEVVAGHWYATRGGFGALLPGERLFTALPVYHCNSLIYSFFRMLLSGGCQIQTDRFHPKRWWNEIIQTEANIFHYLGVLIPMLMNQPPSDNDRSHRIRFGVGAGVEPELHAAFEERFGVVLIEQWGMTEVLCCLGDYHPPRRVGTRAFGKPVPGLEARVVDDHDVVVSRGEPGEMLVRHSEQTPRKNFFSGYLNDAAATEEAWRGGWFHTGDIVRQDDDGTLHFVERKKNIIRRSGENIAPAEVENLLMAHPLVRQAAVLAVPDEIREEEVLACIELKSGLGDENVAEDVVSFCLKNMAYYKAPGWIYFMDKIPVTGTMKVQKHKIFDNVNDFKSHNVIDVRRSKKRTTV